MSALRWILVIVGILFLLFGTIFALQGANIIGGSALMSGNPTYIYLGAVVVLVGVILIGVGAASARSKDKTAPSSSSIASQPGST